MFYIHTDDTQTLSITDVLFPGQASSLPQNHLLNMTFNCATGQLDFHIKLSGEVQIVPQVLSLSNLVLSIRATLGTHSALKVMILSAKTQMFSLQAFVAVKYNFQTSKFSIKGIPTATNMLNQISQFTTTLSSLPKQIADMTKSRITTFYYNLENKQLILHATLEQITLIPNVLKLTNVVFNIDIVTNPTTAINHLSFSGTWKIGTISVTTKVVYNGAKKLLHMTVSAGSGNTLNIAALMKNVAGISHNIPSQLTSLSLNSVVGNVYASGKFFIAMSGSVAKGKLYLLLYKGASGMKVGIAASMESFRLSNLIKSATGVDITSVPYFGSLVVPAMALSITSGPIQSLTLPHIFGKGSPLLYYNDMLPAGITSQFKLDIGSAKGVIANFAHGVINFKLPKSLSFDVKDLVAQIPGVSEAINSLPDQIKSILSAKLISFSFNSTSKDLSISASLKQFTLVTGFLSISDVQILYDGVLGKNVNTRLLEFVGTWNIGDYSILTSIHYDGVEKQLTVRSQSQGGKQLSVNNILESLAGTEVPLPSVVSSFNFTSLSGKMAQSTVVIAVNGQIGKGKISAVFEKTATSDSAGAVVADVSSFKLSELIKSATGVDISGVPFLGPMVIAEMKFSIATGNISSPLLAEVAGNGSPLEKYKNGILEGVSGIFTISVGDVKGITVKFVQKKLTFTVPDVSSLSLETILSTMPSFKEVLQKLPQQLSAILSAKITAFSYNPTFKEFHFSGSIEKEVIIVPQFISLTSVKISLTVIFGKPVTIKNVDFSGNWLLKTLPILTTVSYNREEKRLDVTGEIGKGGSGANIKKLITSISGQDLSIPSALSSVTLKKLSGNKIGDVTLVTLSGSVGQGNIYLIYQKSPSGSAVAFAADTPKFRLSSLVSSTTGLDITSFPFFGTLIIPQIGFTISSKAIENPLLSSIYASGSPLSKFGDSISKGVTATFGMSVGSVKGIIANYMKGELSLNVPDSVELSLANILKQIPGVQEVINDLPTTLRELGSARLHRIIFSPSTRALDLTGSLKTLTIVPNFLSLQNIRFSFSGIIGANSTIKFASFRGDWFIKSLALTTEVIYDRGMLLIEAFPKNNETLDIKQIISSLSGTDLAIPSVLKQIKFKKVIGKVQGETTSVVLLGEIGNKGKIGIAYQKSKTGKVVVFAADLPQFKLADLVKAGTGLDISNVPFFGTFTIPAISFSISSNQFSSALFPDLKFPGVPKELLLESIPKGVRGQFLADIGNAIGIKVTYSENILTMEAPPTVSLSLQTLLSIIPEVKSAVDALPSQVKNILSAKITKLIFNPATKELFISLSLDSLTILPKIISLKDIQVSFDVTFKKSGSPLSLNSFKMKGKWVIRSIEIETSISYEKVIRQLHIEGAPSGASGLSISDLIKALSGADLSFPKVISTLKLKKVVANSDPGCTTVILSATAGSSDVYLVFQKTTLGSSTAIAADIEQFKLADVIKSASGLDVSNVPFIGSFVISTLAFSVSTKEISNPLLDKTYASDSPLQKYGGTIPRGLTAYFKANIGGTVGIEVTYAQKLLDFNVPTGSSLSLQALLSEIPKINAIVKGLPSPLSDLLACKLKAIRFDPPSKTLAIAAKLAQITIIPTILQIKNLEVSFVAVLGSPNAGLQSLDFSADWILRNINIRIKVSYDRTSKEVLFAAIPKQGLNIKDLIAGLTGKHLPIPSVINSVKLIKIIGQKSADVFTFIFSGSISGKAGVHLIYQRFGATSRVAIAAGIQSFKLAELVRSAVNIDISGVPFFGKFSVPSMGLIISSEMITTSLLSESLLDNSPLSQFGNTLPKGFTAKFNTPIGSIKGIIGSYENKVLSFSVPPNVDASIGALLTAIPGVDSTSLALPSVFGDILKIQLRSFAFDIPKKEMSLQIFLNKITFYENVLSMTNTHLKIIAKLSAPRSITAEVKSTITLGKTDYAVDVRRDPTTKKYVLTVETEKLPVFGIVKAIGAKLLPDDLNIILGQVFNFNILNARIVYPFGAQPQQLLISGTPQMFGLKTMHITALAIKYSGRVRVIQKYSFGTFRITDFIKKLLGVSLHKFTLLNQDVDIAFTVSPSTLKGLKLSIPEFKDTPNIYQGITFNIPFGWPKNCASDGFCAVAKKLLGGVKLRLEATITNARSFTLIASIGNLKLGGGVLLERAGIRIVSGVSPSIGIVGSISLKSPKITLTVAIAATAGGVQLEGSMSGCWYNAFGSSYLTICNLFLAMSIVPSPAPISGLQFGGRIEVGKKSCGRAITAEGYIGINYVNPNENYFYANIGPVTFQSFFNTFCLNVKLPRPLAESGFPNGIKTSFSLLGKELPHAGISIPPGYRFKGTINILGLKAHADINIQLPTRIYVNIGLPPLRIANIFKMYASRRDKSRGPYLIADISIKKAPRIEASGFVEVLGISVETKLLITSSKYELKINGRFLNLFKAWLHITANYGSFSKASYTVEGYFKSDLFDRLASFVRNALKRSADEADRHIKAAQNKIRSAQAKLDGVNRNLEGKKRNLDNVKRKFDAAISKLEAARRKVNNICHIRSCGSGKICIVQLYTYLQFIRVYIITVSVYTTL